MTIDRILCRQRWSPVAGLALVVIVGLLGMTGCGETTQPAAQSVLPTPDAAPAASSQATGAQVQGGVVSPLPTPAGAPPDLRTTDLGDGWVQYELAGAGVTITLPIEWHSYPLADKESYLSPVGIDQLVDLDAVRFYALDLSTMYTSQRYPVGVIVLGHDLGESVSLEAQTALALENIRAYAGPEVVVEQRPTALSGVEAREILFRKEQVGDLAQPMMFVLYLVPDGERLYKVVFQVPSDMTSTHLELVRTIAGRFRLTEQSPTGQPEFASPPSAVRNPQDYPFVAAWAAGFEEG